MTDIIRKKTVQYEINGKRYDRIEDIPAEFRALVQAINENPGSLKGTTVTKVTTQSTGDIPAGLAGMPGTDHREKFLRETVLPNLHRLDAKAQAEVLKEIGGGASEGQTTLRRVVFWIILYGALGILLKLGYSVVKSMFSLP
ncbi:MAG TPA: hypothetical protein VN604_07330 [Nitrospirota bacterium]|nr:hypothetical protein [Nitrospirota bacterium]